MDVLDNDNNAAIMLIGNKCDLSDRCREVTIEEGKQMAKKINAVFMETSAKDGININECYQEMVRQIIRKTFEDPRDSIMMYENHSIPKLKIVMQGAGAVGMYLRNCFYFALYDIYKR